MQDEGEEGDVGLYHGSLYQYTDEHWQPINRELYYGPSATLPPAEDGRYFLCTANGYLDDVLYLNDEPFIVNDEEFCVFTHYEKGYIYVYEDHHWQRKEPDEDYRYIVAMGDYYNVNDELPSVIKSEVSNIARTASSNYYGPLLQPPQNPTEGEFFLYTGQTGSGENPQWVQYKLYIYRNGDWQKLDENNFQNRNYFMQALQDILTNAPATTGYFSTAFCNAFFANQASVNALSTKVIFLQGDGVIKSDNWVSGESGLLIDAAGNIEAYGTTYIGENAIIAGNISGATGTFSGNLNITGEAVLKGRTIIEGDAIFKGDIDSGPLELNSVQPTPKIYTYPAGSKIPFGELCYNVIGTYNGTISFDTCSCGQGSGVSTRLSLKKNGIIVYQEEHQGDTSNKHTLDYNMTYYYNGTSGSKTFKLKNLPTTQPAESNTIWRDSNGFLKIS